VTKTEDFNWKVASHADEADAVIERSRRDRTMAMFVYASVVIALVSTIVAVSAALALAQRQEVLTYQVAQTEHIVCHKGLEAEWREAVSDVLLTSLEGGTATEESVAALLRAQDHLRERLTLCPVPVPTFQR
jgi:hypothetical protein